MTEYCFESTNSTTNNTITKKNNKITNFASICSSILSHPLYLSYLIFFSPSLLKLLSFLSPLFITTSLLVLSLLTTLIPLHSVLNSKEGFFLAAYNTLLEKLCPRFDDEGEKSQLIEEFDLYKIVFETPVIDVMEENPDEGEKFEENPVGFSEEKVPQEEIGTGDPCESLTTKPSKVKEEVKKYEAFLTRTGSEANKIPISEGIKPKSGSSRFDDEKKLSEAFSQTVGSPPYLGSFSSMRKEREWRRTLACKLFEERHNWSFNEGVNGGDSEEGMDLLWETHETESNRGKPKEDAKQGRRRERIEDLMVVNDEDYDDDNGKFCCLQALKLSAGKMNLNMGRPNLIKIGKAFKGMGWLQSHGRRQSKKGYK